MAKSGNVVTGYNDDLDRETLIEITGSETFANKLAAGFDKKNIPLTKENARMAKEVYDRVSEIGSLSEDATKYMIENNMEPTKQLWKLIILFSKIIPYKLSVQKSIAFLYAKHRK